MIRDITLGQYFAADSFVHRLDARGKIVLVFAYMVAIFFAKTPIGCGALVLFLALGIALSKVPIKFFVRGLKPILFFLIFTVIINMLLSSGTPIFVWKFIKITEEGLYFAGMSIFRMICLVFISALLTYTSSPVSLTAAIESLLSPLKIVKFPSHEIAMMMTIALRMIPTILEETDKIMKAQSARCADFESGNILRRVKAFIPLLVPLFISAFRRADDLAVAMESRCYNGGDGRTSMNVPKLYPRDFAVFFVFTAMFTTIVLMKI